ncbi:hypothetical protein AB1286_19070 [Trinickia sp. NRRL B-1857]|uniref:hypothetical protein n=1 Tax=Trinickia sp. NRRL B-1857 TaxID=3162879 RepID=UPI003D2B8F49
MSYCRRIFIVVLLILSLPVQSYAAVSMTCAAVLADAGESAVLHLDSSASEHHHDMRTATSAGDAHHHDGSRHLHACSTCVSCCIGAGLPAAPAVAISMANILVAIRIPPSAGVVSFLTGGIDRPPRHTLV